MILTGRPLVSERELLTTPIYKLSAATGIPRSTLWSRRKALATKEGLSVEVPVAAEGLKRELPEDTESLLDEVSSLAARLLSERGATKLNIDLSAETHPIGLAFTGDWHVGGIGVDYPRLYSDIETLAATSGLYIFGMGDYGDNYKAAAGRASAGLYDAVLANPDDQQRVWGALLAKLGPKLLGLTLGCHLDWDFYRSGHDPLAEVCEKLGTANLGHGAVVSLTVGTQKYSGLVRHRLPGESALSTTNPQRRATNEYPTDDPFDFVALGHRHFNDLQTRSVNGQQRVWLRSGSYKVWDRYAQSLGGYVGEPGVPILILYPRERKLVAFWGGHLAEALEFLRRLRDGLGE